MELNGFESDSGSCLDQADLDLFQPCLVLVGSLAYFKQSWPVTDISDDIAVDLTAYMTYNDLKMMSTAIDSFGKV